MTTRIAMIKGLPIVFTLVLVFSSAARAEDPQGPEGQGPTTESIARNCTGCHGIDGKSPGSIPTIYGKSADWMAERLKEFRDGKRDSTIMQRIIKPFADSDIQAIAKYFATRK